MKEVVIVSGVRTAIGGYMGSLSKMTPVELGVAALNGAIEKAGIDKGLIQEVVCGQCNQAGSPGNTARHIAMGAGLPVGSFAFTIHQQCASSMRGAELLALEIIIPGIQAGLFRPVDPQTTAALLMTIYLGSASQVNEAGQTWLEAAQVAEFAINALLKK